MTKTELKNFLLCSESEINELQKYVKEFFGDYYNYLVKDTVINHTVNYQTIIDIFYIFNEMNLRNIKNSPEFFFKNIGNYSDKGLKSWQIVEQMLGLWAFNILDNRSAGCVAPH